MDQPTADKIFHAAVAHHQAGRLPQAEGLYRQILAEQPDHREARHLLGVVAHQVGRNDVAIELIQQAIALRPDFPEAHSDLGLIYHAMGRAEEAVAAFHRALVLNPKSPGAHNNLGNFLRSQGQFDAAIASYREAIFLRPDFPEAHSNLGSALHATGRIDEAIASYRRALAINANLPEAHGNLGVALKDRGQFDQAMAACQQAIALRPNYAAAYIGLGNALQASGRLEEAITAYHRALGPNAAARETQNFPGGWVNLGNALQARGRLDEAITSYRQAIAFQPNYPEAYSNLGAALKASGRMDEAIAAFLQAIALNPQFPDAHSNLGSALGEKGQIDDAITACRRAIALHPRFASAYVNLGNTLKDAGQLDEAVAAFRQAITHDPNIPGGHANLLYTLHFHPGYNSEAIADEHRTWNRRYAAPLRPARRRYVQDRGRERRLRIGYISPDFREHPVGRFLAPLLTHHDKKKIEVFAYSDVRMPDKMTQRVRAFSDQWRDIVGQSDAQLGELIRQDKIDILVDLTMHMAGNRLLVFARQPAPVQVTYLAYCSTTGLETIDYRLSDPYLDPSNGRDSIYSEETVRLPETYWCYQPLPGVPDFGPLPALEQGGVTFGSLNNFCKASDQALATWARLLGLVPNSRLILHCHEGSHRDRVTRHLAAAGVASSRVHYVGLMPADEYFSTYRRIDIALDTFPYGGGTTTCDALWMGVPVVSLRGKTAVGRGGFSILSNVGLPELVARSEEHYLQIAADLAGNLPRLRGLRSSLRGQMERSPLMDAPRFARNVEAAYRRMWRAWCETETTSTDPAG
ncbi:MAG: tetratricopeptide repeat protein [Opitutus sp.]|nr:tetratricopeptide repeat protein [Opitutus sp.]